MCACCGAKQVEFLTIDHIHGGGAKHRRSLGGGSLSGGASKLYSWLRRNGFPEGYRVLCQNCNFSRGVFGYCPHEHPEKAMNYDADREQPSADVPPEPALTSISHWGLVEVKR